MTKFNIKKFITGESTKVKGSGGYKSVKFEGFMCSAISEDGTHYFTVDENGIAKKLFNESEVARIRGPQFTLKHTKSNDVKPKFIDCKQSDEVEIVRHFRRWDNCLHAWSNAGGLTVICVLNYDTMKMQVFPAFCSNEENFDKRAGLYAAQSRKDRNIGIEFDFERNMTIKMNLWKALRDHDAGVNTITRTDCGSGSTPQNAVIYDKFMECLDSSHCDRWSAIL